MNFKLKAVVAAVAFAAAAHAGAATIDNGAKGNGGLFFNLWDSTGSYSLNLGMDLNSFESLVNSKTSFATMTFGADSTLSNWISGKTSYNWNIMAVDSQGSMRVLETIGSSATLTTKASDIVRTASAQTTTLANAIDTRLASANSATFTTADAGYVGKSAGGVATINNNIGFANVLGTAANNSFTSGLKFEEALANASGTAKVPAIALGSTLDVRAYFNGSTLTIAAAPVPEPETYAMFLAGLGLMGVIARRRNRA